MDRAFILAAGDSVRLDNRHKQLIELQHGETILGRIVRQVHAREYEPVIVTHKEKIADHVDLVTAIYPEARRWTVETLLSTAPWWTNKTIVLLGDVVYSRRVMDEVARSDKSVCVFGHEYEIFAVTFMLDKQELVKDALRKVVDVGYPGTLRWFYQQYCGLPLGGNEVEDEVFHRVCYIEDYTRDVDTPQDLESLRIAIRRGRLRDE